MSTVERRRSGGLKTVDRLLVGAGIVGGVLVVLWAVSAVAHLALFVIKVVILVVVVAAVVRLVHLFTRRR